MTDITGPRQDLIDRNNAAIQEYQRTLVPRKDYEALLRSPHEGSTHWIGDDGYEGCWREHRVCAEQRVKRLEAALRASYIPHFVVEGDPWFDCPEGSRKERGYHLRCDKDCDCACECGAGEHNARIDAALTRIVT
jgi:hypothetical protein